MTTSAPRASTLLLLLALAAGAVRVPPLQAQSDTGRLVGRARYKDGLTLEQKAQWAAPPTGRGSGLNNSKAP